VSPRDELWKLFDDKEAHPEFKIRFWETAGDLIARNFYQPYLAWCEKHGKLFTGHLKGEESPYFQLMFSGSCFTQLKGLSLPAIDTLERYHGNHFFPHLLLSVAAQQGRSGCLAEAMGGAGWGVAPENVESYMLWLAEAGVERIVLHLGQLLLKARAIRDWPPSVPLHLTWHGAFAELLDHIRKRAEPLLQMAWDAPKTLIITPTRGVMASYRPHYAEAVNLHDGSGIPESESARINADFLDMVEKCHAAGLRYHFTEERELKNASLCGQQLQLGAMRYEKILVADGCRFESDEKDLIDEMKKRDMLVTAPEIKIKKVTKASEPFAPEQGAWNISFPKENQMLIEWNKTGSGELCASIATKQISAPITLVFSDPIKELRVNGTRTEESEPKTYRILDVSDILHLKVTPAGEALPFAWLKGDFAVLSADGWKEFGKEQMTSEGRFLLDGSAEAKKLCAGELVSQGLPFFGGLLTTEKSFGLKQDFSGELDFEGLGIAAARVLIGGAEIGWWWNGHPLGITLASGAHTVTLEAAPSTYNTYGPHHYYLGDCRLTSPDTFFGRGGYTDNPDAPANTFVDSMQFVKFTVDGRIILK
jgi:hypothetical protein